MEFRTDLAVEYTPEDRHERSSANGCKLTRIQEDGNRFVTLEVPPLTDDPDLGALNQLRDELRAMVPEAGLVLVVGIGNRDITPDALGPLTAGGVLATRHIKGELARISGLSGLRPVAAVAPGVLGCTGIEAGEAVAALIRELSPAAVIAVDAMAARGLDRLGCTVQLCDSGIAPGSGVENCRPRLDETTLGVPVLGLGIPTVVDASTLAVALLGGKANHADVEPRGAKMMVTPREIDLLVRRGAKLLALAINMALNPSLSMEDFMALV